MLVLATMSDEPVRLLYCHCAYAQVVPRETRDAVLRRLCEAGVRFEAVADLCELSARRDVTLQRLANGGPVKIAACYPRAVKWLFAASGNPLRPDSTEVLNMRVQAADEVLAGLLQRPLQPNLPAGKAAPPPAAEAVPANGPAPEPALTVP